MPVLALALVASGLIAATSGSAAHARATGCDRPLTYDVVRIDPGEHISRAAFVALLQRSERLWEVPTAQDLFRYQPGGTVHVSLVYDARQALENRIDAKDRAITSLRATLDRQGTSIEAQRVALQARESRLSVRVGYWDARGGAPHNLLAVLNDERVAINGLIRGYNATLRRQQTLIARFDALLGARNALVRASNNGNAEAGQAQLGGTEMSIFVLHGTALDEVLIAHELGHILGLEHIAGADNIMNPQLVKVVTRASLADLQALRTACAIG